MKIKKLMALALAGATMAGSALTASAATEITFWTLNTRQAGAEMIVEEFNAMQDEIHVTASFYDTDGMKDACKVAASSDTLPSMWFNWGGSLGQFYVDNGKTCGICCFFMAGHWSADDFVSGWSAVRAGGSIGSGYDRWCRSD